MKVESSILSQNGQSLTNVIIKMIIQGEVQKS